MEIFNFVKYGNKYIGIEDIQRGEYYVCGLDYDETVQEFLGELGIGAGLEDAARANALKCACNDEWELPKLLYNPLLMKQDVFLIGENGQYQVPYLLIKHRRELGFIESRFADLKTEDLAQVYQYLVKYIFTKDLRYINSLVNHKAVFDPLVFSVLNKAINVDAFNPMDLDEAIIILNGREVMKTPVYSRYVERVEEFKSKARDIYKKVKSDDTNKNVVLIHLESLSNEIYYNQLRNFPVLNELADKSLRLNYYSSASSSCMSLIDLFFGNDFESDSFPVFDEMYLGKTYCKNMYRVFRENGYNVAGIGYKELKSEEINHFNLWNVDNQQYEWKDSFAEFSEAIEKFIIGQDKSARKPFALHIWNLLPHIGHNDEDTYKGRSYLERMDLSYTSLDMTVGLVLDRLKKQGILDDTIIICYGDHGDDKWTRSMNYGCTHIIPPHLNVIKCPAFIFDSRIEPGILTDIMSTIDMKNTALFLAGIENREAFPHQGVNIFEVKNEFVYSRSHLTNQRLDQKINSEWVTRLNNFNDNEHKNKSFGVVNHSYNMVVGKNGLEFFMHKNDPGNYNNLLSFFEIDNAGDIKNFNNHGAWRGHFRSIMMADDQIFDIVKNYYILREALIKRIELKNSLIDSDEKNLFDMTLFNKARERGFMWV